MYGFGRLCKEFLKNYLHKDRICKIFDSNLGKKGLEFQGIEIASIDELDTINKDSQFIVTTAYFFEVKKFLAEKGFFNISFVYSLRNECQVAWEENYHIHPALSQEELVKIDQLNNNLSDEHSKYILKKVIEKRKNEIFDYSDICSLDKQYFPNIDKFKISFNEVFVDAGAYIGDTLDIFCKVSKGKWDTVYCFEPDKNNFIKLESEASKLNNVVCFQSAVGKNDGKVEFYSGIDASSSFNNVGGEKSYIVVKSIDNLLIAPTYIKMDVEGAEMEALQGAEKIIKKYKPKLAICVYHRSVDIWQIPLYIKSLVPEYNLYLDHYSNNWCETVLYATT